MNSPVRKRKGHLPAKIQTEMRQTAVSQRLPGLGKVLWDCQIPSMPGGFANPPGAVEKMGKPRFA